MCQVYKVLDATPRDGVKFSRAVREVLAREVTWVMWKKGGKDFGELRLVGLHLLSAPRLVPLAFDWL
jgi:hypothetical protein